MPRQTAKGALGHEKTPYSITWHCRWGVTGTRQAGVLSAGRLPRSRTLWPTSGFLEDRSSHRPWRFSVVYLYMYYVVVPYVFSLDGAVDDEFQKTFDKHRC